LYSSEKRAERERERREKETLKSDEIPDDLSVIITIRWF